MSLLQQTARSTAWTVVGSQTATAAAFATSIFVAHLLSPAEIGRYALAAMIVGLAGASCSLYAGNYYVITTAPSKRLLETGLALELGLGAAVWFVLAIGAAVFAVLSGGSNFAALLVVEGLVLMANPFGNPVGPLSATFTRDFRYRVPTVVWIASVLTSSTLKVGLALEGLGAWALVIGDVALVAMYGAVMLMMVPAGRTLSVDRDLAGTLVGFGIPSAATGFMTVLGERASELAVAVVLGTHQLGLYYLAARLPTQLYQLGGGLSVAFLTAFSRSDQRQLERGFALATRMSAFFIFLPLALAIPLAEPFITLVYGAKWEAAATPFALLMGAIAVRFTFWHVANALKSRGRVREIALLTGGQLVLVGVSSLVGASLAGLVGAAAAALAAEIALVIPKIKLIRSLVRFHPIEALRLPALTLAVGIGIATTSRELFPDAEALVASTVALTTLFALAAWRSDPSSFGTIVSSFRRRVHGT